MMNINSLASLAVQLGAHSRPRPHLTRAHPAASANSNGLADPNLFITLLTAQLQAQDPLDPMSPEDMVNQIDRSQFPAATGQYQSDAHDISRGPGTSGDESKPLG